VLFAPGGVLGILERRLRSAAPASEERAIAVEETRP
jgi:hypothetical protein